MDNLATITITLFQPAPGPSGFEFPLVTALTAFMALPVKFLVDVVKGWNKVPGSMLPLVGIVIGYVFCLTVLTAARTPLDGAVFAQCALAAVGAQIMAMAATWNQTRANKVEERIQTALDLPQGSSKAEVDAQVFSKETQ